MKDDWLILSRNARLLILSA